MKAFGEIDLRDYFQTRLSDVDTEVRALSSNELLNVDAAQYIEYLTDTHKIEPLILLWDEMSISDFEKSVRAEDFPPLFNVDPGRTYPVQVIRFHLPFVGDPNLVKCKPSTSLFTSPEVKLDVPSSEITFDFVNFSREVQRIEGSADTVISSLRKQHDYVAKEVDGFNARLEQRVSDIIKKRRDEHLERNDLLERLGVPVRKASVVPETFEVPSIKKKVITKPVAPQSTYQPEPALDEKTYRDILNTCYQIGVEMERLPRTYFDKDEESLRDHFILVLSPNFESVTAETFNSQGKTDILIRHEQTNVFVAECKFWKGRKQLLSTTDQALSYLTWRDSKTALLVFVRNKEIGPVLAQVEDVMMDHPCFVRSRGRQEESWFEYDFHLPGDSSRGVRLAVLLFHFPPTKS